MHNMYVHSTRESHTTRNDEANNNLRHLRDLYSWAIMSIRSLCATISFPRRPPLIEDDEGEKGRYFYVTR